VSESKTVAPSTITVPLNKVTSLQEAFDHPQFKKRLIEGLPPGTISPERMMRVCMQAVQRQPLLARAPVLDLIGAFMTCSLVGLEPNTHLQHAHLIPFKAGRELINGKWQDSERYTIQLIFGYQGLLDLVYRTGRIDSVHADVVWAGDEFSFSYGTNQHLNHKPAGTQDESKDTPGWAYMHGAVKGGGQSFEVMPWASVMTIRNRSQGYRAALRALEYRKPGQKEPGAYTEAPWVKYPIPMARKTAFRAGQKWLPKSIELAAALTIDERQDTKNLRFRDVVLDQDALMFDGIGNIEEDAEGGGDPRFTDRRGDVQDVEDVSERKDPPAPTETKRKDTAATKTKPAAPAADAGGPPPGHPAAGDDDPGPEDDGAGAATDAASVDEFYLSDEHGEPVDGDAGYATSAVDFIRKYRAVWETSKNRDALAEHNSDGMQDALQDPAAAKLHEEYSWAPPAAETTTKAEAAAEQYQASAAPSWPIELPKKAGRPDLPNVPGAFRAAVAKITDADTMRAFIEAHAQVIGRLPGVTKANVNTAIAQRSGELGMETRDQDREWLDSILKDELPKLKTQQEVKDHLTGTAYAVRLNRIEREKAEMFENFKAAVNAHMGTLAK